MSERGRLRRKYSGGRGDAAEDESESSDDDVDEEWSVARAERTQSVAVTTVATPLKARKAAPWSCRCKICIDAAEKSGAYVRSAVREPRSKGHWCNACEKKNNHLCGAHQRGWGFVQRDLSDTRV